MTAQPDPTGPRPYEQTAVAYWETGWTCPLPLPAGRKHPPPDGFTGHDGDEPSYADIMAWVEDRPRSNIGLRLPPLVIGIDVDNYVKAGQQKHGLRTLREWEHAYGPLPQTWRSTSRDDGISGILLFRLPEGLEYRDWPGVLVGGDVEVIHAGYRYAVVYPSVHPEGGTYRWYRPDGLVSTLIPDVMDLPPLPISWLQALNPQPHSDARKADLDTGQVNDWIASLPGAKSSSCTLMASRTIEASKAISNETGSRHDAALKQVLAIVRFAEQGHTGITEALDKLRARFITLVVGDGSRSTREAFSEWTRITDGAVRKVVANPEISIVEGDPCGPAMGRIDLRQPVPTRSEPIRNESPTPPPADTQTEADTRSGSWERVDEQILAALQAEMARVDSQPVTPVQTPDAMRVASGEDHSEWWWHSLEDALSGAPIIDGPEQLARVDGLCAFYMGEVNGLIGESESGKTWVMLEACRQAVQRGDDVLYFDFESSDRVMVERLRALGLSDTEIRTRFHYCRPDGPLTQQVVNDIKQMFDIAQPVVVCFDGVNAALTNLGKDSNSTNDTTEFYQKVLQPLASRGSCVIFTDHIKKNNDGSKGAIGSQAKRAMTTGALFLVEVIHPFGRGQRGMLRMSVDKDRRGHVRGACGLAPESGRQVWGVVSIDSDGFTGHVSVRIRADADQRAITAIVLDDRMMRAVSDYLVENGSTPKERIAKALSKQAAVVADAISALEQAGCVRVVELPKPVGQRGPSLIKYCQLVRPYPPETDTRFNSFQLVPDLGNESGSTRSPISYTPIGVGESERVSWEDQQGSDLGNEYGPEEEAE
jgi:hypothetical protein